MKKLFFIALILIPFIATAQSYQKRLALVIGNSNYEHGGSLPNPVNDANEVAAALQSVGFEVMKYQNVTQKEMKTAINAFGQKLNGYDVGVFYYAGHGIQNKGMNYMIPVEADLQMEAQIEFDCVAADRVLAYMEAAQVKVNVIIMDACRNNPFERSWHRAVNGNGLAIMNAPTGTLIAYATAPGRVASDGEGSNGLYTSALLKYMRDPALTIEQVFKKVRTEVTQKSSGAQVPWETTSLTGDDFYFATNGIASGKIINNSNDVLAKNTDAKKSLANRSVTEVSEENRKKAKELVDQGHTEYNKNNHAKAIEYYTQAIQLDPNLDDAYYWRSSARYTTKQYKEALADCNKTLEINPSNEQGYYQRAITYFMLESYSEAIVDFNKSIELNPDVSSVYYWRGQSKYYLKKYEEAASDYSKALELNRNDGAAFGGRANSYYMLGKYEDARADYTKAIEFTPADEAYYAYWRGTSNYNLDRTQEALVDFLTCIRNNPNDDLAFMMAGNCNYILKNYSEAIEYYTKNISLKPGNAEAYYWRAYSYFLLGKKSEALRDIDKAISLEPANGNYKKFKTDNF